MNRIVLQLFSLCIAITPLNLMAQQSLNVSLFGQLDPVPIRYSGSWGYTDQNQNEYALLGTNTGLSVISIDDSLNIQQLDFIPGPASNWREITVVNDHAYITTEANSPFTGMQVVDLSYLPDSVHLVQNYTSTFTTGHIIQRDASGGSQFIYVMGTSTGTGVHFLDISNPGNPLEVGQYAPYYIHDSHIRGDTLFACAIYNGTVDIVDISNKSNPVLLQQISYPGAFTHSCWTSDDRSHLIVCDEIDGLPARIWNIEDFSNIYEVAQFTANDSSLVHNPYVLGNHVFLSHNTEGLRIIDWTKKDVPVEVGYYDTYIGASGGFHGLWSAYPYFSSEKIIGGNREDGLKIWKFNGALAGRFYGNVTDSVTGASISNAQVTINQTNKSTNTDLVGSYKFGEIASDPAGYTVTASATGYFSKTSMPITLNEGDSLWLPFELVSLTNTKAEISKPLSEFSIYPNPAVSTLIVYIHELGHADDYNLEIIDLAGSIILNESMEGNETTVDISMLAAGKYFIVLSDSQYNRSVKSFEIMQ